MSTSRRTVRMLVTGAAAAFVAAPTAVLMFAESPSVHNEARPCYNGVTRYDPWAPSCSIPGPQNKIRGSAPDANAIIACRNIPGCLSWYVNNP